MNAIPLRTESPRYLTTAETAKLLRQELKRRFPATKFSVRSHVYAGGSSIDVGWTDGPTEQRVKSITAHYEGADFDGMIDLKTYRSAVPHDGELVKMGADFIFTKRRLSAGFLTRVVAEVGKHYHVSNLPAVTAETEYFGAQLEASADQTSPLVNGADSFQSLNYWSWRAIVFRAAADRTTLN